MRIEKKSLALFISLLLSVIFGTFIWEFISLPFTDPGIIGEYSLNNFNSTNDIFRYIVFIGLPIFIYVIFQFLFQKFSISNLKLILNENEKFNFKTGKSLHILFIILIVLIFIDFLSVDFPIHKIDSFHEGQRLSSSYKSLMDNSLWSGSYLTTGVFHEIFGLKIIWKIFGHESIGLARFVDIFLVFVMKLLLIVFTFLITKFLNLNNFYKNIFFIFNSFIFLSLLNYNIASVDQISYREIPVILTTILFIIFLTNKSFNNLILIILASISVLSVLWGVDRGLVTNIIIISICIFLFLIKDNKKLFLLFFSSLFFWLLFYVLAGNEFDYFISNTYSILKEMNYVHGIIHPTPFSEDPNSYRASKTLISIIICLLVSIDLFFKISNKFSISFKTALFMLALISFLSYIYALGRSDGPHIKSAFGYPIIFFSIYFSYLIIYKISRKNFDLIKPYNYLIITLFLIILSNVFLDIKFSNVKNYNERFKKYSNLPDNFYLNKDEFFFINKAKKIVNNQDCIQLFSNDAAFIYLLRSKSCTKFYLVWSASSIVKQKELIKELKKDQIIIANGPKDNWDMPLSEKLFLVNDYIVENYSIDMTIKEWSILKPN